MATPVGSEVWIEDVATGWVVRRLRGRRTLTCVAWSPDGGLLFAGDGSLVLERWDLEVGDEPLPEAGHLGVVFGLDFSPDSTRIAAGDGGGRLREWRIGGAAVSRVLADGGPSLEGLAYSPDGKHIAALCEPYGLQIWSCRTARRLLPEEDDEHARGARFVAFSEDGLLAAAGQGDGTMLWNLHTDPAHVFERIGRTTAPHWLHLGRTIVDLRAGGMTQWDVVLRRATLTHSAATLTSIGGAASPDGRWALRHGWNGYDLVDVATRKVVATWDVAGCDRIRFSPDARLVAFTDLWCSLRIYDTATGLEVPWRGVTEGIASVAFSPDGRLMATGMRDTTILLWPSPLSARPEKKAADDCGAHSDSLH